MRLPRTPIRLGRIRPDAGMTLVETSIFTAIVVPAMVALAVTVGTFTRGAEIGHHRSLAVGQSQEILNKIAAELSGACTRRDHPMSDPAPIPLPLSPGDANDQYNRLSTGGVPSQDTLHATQDRDGAEYWHPPWQQRRFYIYATYQPFDTLEYQRIRTPDDMSHLNGGGPEEVNQPWSSRRKIFLEDGSVLLRVEDAGGGAPRTVVLGTHVETLEFHVNSTGQIVIRLEAASGGGDRQVSRVSQLTVYPRNGLF